MIFNRKKEKEQDAPKQDAVKIEEQGVAASNPQQPESEQQTGGVLFQDTTSLGVAPRSITPVGAASQSQTVQPQPQAQSPQSQTTQPQAAQKTVQPQSNVQQPKAGKKKKRTGVIIGCSAASTVALVYVGVSVFFMDHFLINTNINGMNFSGKTVEDAKTIIAGSVDHYKIDLLERGNATESIKGEDIQLSYEDNGDIENILKTQNAFLWPVSLFSTREVDVPINVSYDEEALKAQVNKLKAVTDEQIAPVNAYPKYKDGSFVVEPEIDGTTIIKDTLNEKVSDHIQKLQSSMNLEDEGCYEEPQYTEDSEELKSVCSKMNQYIQAKITYTMKDTVVVDKELISQWVTVDDDLNITFNTDEVKTWLEQFGDNYDTVGTTRAITSPWGNQSEVSGGTYGWSIDEDVEYDALVASIENGEVISKEPAYYQTAASHADQDWGNTYVEIDLSAQHVWYIVDGSIALETDVVTGLPTADKITPQGVYEILDKQSPSTLVGNIMPSTGKPEYETVVSYWMRVTWSGIGLHDATWQPAFGGTLYTSIGSHGCINMPLDQAASLYSMLEVGTPVIIHY